MRRGDGVDQTKTRVRMYRNSCHLPSIVPFKFFFFWKTDNNENAPPS
jgi:hypothetical protein